MADLEGMEDKSANVVKDLFAGAMGGIAQVLLGMCHSLLVDSGFALASRSLFVKTPADHVHRRITTTFDHFEVFEDGLCDSNLA
jgi:hypothetical protein